MKFGIFTSGNGFDLNHFYDFLKTLKIEYTAIGADSDFSGIDYAWIFGGDGTVLHVATTLAKYNVPAVCVNCGHIGFLTDFEYNEIEEAVKLLLGGKLNKLSRMLIDVSFGNKKTTALNDLVVQRNNLNESGKLILDLGVYINGQLADEIAGDGVIVMTPSGSTAYSLSAGGSILSPDVNAIGITPICAHSLHNRPIACAGESEVLIKNFSDSSAYVTIDGVICGYLKADESISVKKSDYVFTTLIKENSNFFEKLNKKLNRRR